MASTCSSQGWYKVPQPFFSRMGILSRRKALLRRLPWPRCCRLSLCAARATDRNAPRLKLVPPRCCLGPEPCAAVLCALVLSHCSALGLPQWRFGHLVLQPRGCALLGSMGTGAWGGTWPMAQQGGAFWGTGEFPQEVGACCFCQGHCSSVI